MGRYTAVVFDLDGTLVDSSGDITEALNLAMSGAVARTLSAEEVTLLLGEGSVRLVEEAIKRAHPVGNYDLMQIHDRYKEHYKAQPATRSTLFAGVSDALAELEEGNISMAVCTNKSQDLAEIVLERLGISQYFKVVVGNDAVPASKPDPKHVLACFSQLDREPSAGLYIGDSTIDETAAKGAGVDFMAVAWAPPEVWGRRLEYSDLPKVVFHSD